jgi:hypothetical protein
MYRDWVGHTVLGVMLGLLVGVALLAVLMGDD